MRKRLLAVLLMALSAPVLPESSDGRALLPWQADVDLDVKGLHIGMPRDQVESAIPSRRDFTIAGVPGALGAMSVTTAYRRDRLDMLTFVFESSRFDQVLAAVELKYPQIFCGLREPTRDNAGRTLGQIICFLEGRGGRISVMKHGTGRTFRYGNLTLVSDEHIAENKAEADARKKDI